jgi:hypothetical protein
MKGLPDLPFSSARLDATAAGGRCYVHSSGAAMPLTAEQFEQLTQLLTTPTAPWRPPARAYAGEERRAAPRTPARGPAELHVAPPGEAARSFTVYVHDVSTCGLGLLSGSPVHTGAAVRVTVTNGHDDVTVRCSVRHCTTLARGLYGVGVNVDDYDARQARPEAPAEEASSAWSGFFARQAAAASKGVTG